MADTKPARRRLGRGLDGLLATGPVAVDQPVAAPKPASNPARGAPSTAGDASTSPSPNAQEHAPRDDHSAERGAAQAADQGGTSTPADGALRSIPVGSITPSPFQPRTVFDDAELAGLADSIRRDGVMQPVLVRPAAGGFELIAGERRWRAAQQAGLGSIPAIVRAVDDVTAAEWSLIENIQRADLNAMDRAEALSGMVRRFGLTQHEVAERVGLDRSTVANLIRLTELEDEIRGLLRSGALGAGHGKALLAAGAGEGRIGLARRAAEEQWSVRALEAAARDTKPARADAAAAPAGPARRTPELEDLERRLGEHLGTKVNIAVRGGGKGRVTIEFFDLDHFDGVLSRLGYRPSET